MISVVGVLAILVLIFDFVLSIWNAYASGYNIGIINKTKQEGFSKIAAYSGLGLAFVGITYVLIVVLSIIAFAVGYIGSATVEYAFAFDFLVFGLMIAGFGLMITIQSILIAAKRRSIGSIFVAIYNVVVEIWDVASYVSGFKQATSILKADREERGNALMIVLIAALIGYFITHAAYKHGLNKAMQSQA